MPVPKQLVLPISQHTGEDAQPVVGIGERVLKGQVVAEPSGKLGAPVHASSSGKVVAVEPWPVAQRHGEPAPCVIIECDGLDTPIDRAEPAAAFADLPAGTLQAMIMQGGIVGLGGAVFPTAQKLIQASGGELEYLILNGVECEPYISCDDVLMRERAREVLSGAQILLHALQIDVAYIVVESDKPEALQRLAEALGELGDHRFVL